MWSVPKPAYSAEEAYLVCSNGALPATKEKLLTAVGDVVAASRRFELAARSGGSHLLQPAGAASVASSELRRNYTSRMARARSAGRYIYDDLRLSAPDGICPLCGHRTVASLDHYMPKEHFPLLAVDPLNLVPACSDCNHAKADTLPSTAGEVPLHPYFDDVEGATWLVADVVEEDPPAVVFHVRAPVEWSPTLASRVELHFRRFQLGRLYSAQAAVTMRGHQELIRGAFTQGGAAAVRERLDDLLRGYRHMHVNSWQAAMFAALRASDWYCEGGFETTV